MQAKTELLECGNPTCEWFDHCPACGRGDAFRSMRETMGGWLPPYVAPNSTPNIINTPYILPTTPTHWVVPTGGTTDRWVTVKNGDVINVTYTTNLTTN